MPFFLDDLNFDISEKKLQNFKTGIKNLFQVQSKTDPSSKLNRLS